MTGIEVRTDDFGVPRVAAVLTKEGAIQTPCVVNCCGKEGTQLAPPKGGLGLLWSSECNFNQLRTGIGWAPGEKKVMGKGVPRYSCTSHRKVMCGRTIVNPKY